MSDAYTKDQLQIDHTKDGLIIKFPVKTIIPSVPFLVDLAALYAVCFGIIYIGLYGSMRFFDILGLVTHIICRPILVIMTPFFFIWNFFTREGVEVTDSALIIKRKAFIFKGSSRRYDLSTITSVRSQSVAERSWTYSVPGLRIFATSWGGVIHFETTDQMTLRIGKNISDEQAEEIAALLQQEIGVD